MPPPHFKRKVILYSVVFQPLLFAGTSVFFPGFSHFNMTHRIHVWHIYLYLYLYLPTFTIIKTNKSGQVCHTWILWVKFWSVPSLRGFPAPERPKNVTAAQAELEKIQGFIEPWRRIPLVIDQTSWATHAPFFPMFWASLQLKNPTKKMC